MGRWRHHRASIGVWLAAVAMVSWLLVHRTQRIDVMGLARGELRPIAALTNGRVMMLPVRLFQQVTQGETLVVLEDDRIQAQLATAAAEAARLRAEVVATESRLAAEAQEHEAAELADARRFAINVEQTRIRELELSTALKTDRIKLEFLRLQQSMFGQANGSGATSELRFRSAETDSSAMEKKIEEDEKTLAQLQLDLQNVRRRHEEFVRRQSIPLSIDTALEPLRAAVSVQQRKIEELSLDRSMLVLRSPMDGVVSEVLRRVGEAVTTGQPILTVAASQPAEVVAYLTAAQRSQVQMGMPVEVELAYRGGPRSVASSTVIGIGPVAEQLPVRLWQNPTLPEWGWPITIAVSPELKVLSGELVGVRVW
jgi:multidrug resistance efflux pump